MVRYTFGRSRERGRKRVPRDGPPTRMTALVTGAPPLLPRIGTCREAIVVVSVFPALADWISWQRV